MKALEVNPQNVMVNHNTAVCYKLLNDNEHAIEYYQKTLKLDPAFLHSIRNLADIYIELGQQKEAMELIQQALKIKPDSEDLQALAEKIKS